ncbi:hypothetical protein BTV20_03185 [Histophilus somni]|uniref:ATPases of ABC transporters with duplicated ATPase domains-containing protein n=1 Tax=Histophilus somni TaxID=731 RepID=A0A9Q7E5B1_HISSO|nr:hypothetical protein [Histophilus somni]ARU64567.1 hypothetical protein BTV18_03180 [Histophilus somni]ARU66354.1 hypothetical protein BTV19_03180 [Histophilus somni]ARU68229.1 hypothetical protein BTV16_03180 [Histophilus somni]ARU70108.1 hypothetical protein BTV20_03185 [Histophilus somni]ARU71982.1 hypothetical protein BTV17_03175 [Histophilus somni]
MNKILAMLTALLLSACVSHSRVNVPEYIKHHEKSYYLVSAVDLETVARYFYLPKEHTVENWQSAVELLHDRNHEKRSLSDRITLRRHVYQNNGVKQFNLYLKDNELYSFVIYEPTEKNPTWQVDIAKGKEVPFCGFIQYQYSFKLMKAPTSAMSKRKIERYLKKYIVDKEIAQLEQYKIVGCYQ